LCKSLGHVLLQRSGGILDTPLLFQSLPRAFSFPDLGFQTGV
jgi:hypothetical protein